MREVEEKILKGLKGDIKSLKRAGHTSEDIIECLIILNILLREEFVFEKKHKKKKKIS